MKFNHKTFDKSFWKSFGWFLFLVIIICCLPWVLTREWIIDFSDTGEIGDTIGGIMGPFVAIAAAGLTFIAFWVQYKANIQQRHDIAIERQEAKFYKMLDIYSAMTNGLEIHGIKGKEAFAELVGEFTFTFFTIDKIFKKKNVIKYIYHTQIHRSRLLLMSLVRIIVCMLIILLTSPIICSFTVNIML